MKNLFVWPGGKGREFKKILFSSEKTNQKIYVEPFLGSGFSFLNIDGFDEYIINDISEEVYNFFKSVKNRDKDFISGINEHIFNWESDDLLSYLEQNLHPEIITNAFLKYYKKWGDDDVARETIKKQLYFNLVRERYNKSLLSKKLKPSDAADFLFLRQYSFSGMLRYSGEGRYNVPYGGFRYNGRTLRKKLELILSDEINKKMKKTKIYNLDFIDFFNEIKNDNCFVFLDPPYDSEFTSYTGDSFTFEHQIKLFEILKERKFDFFNIMLLTDRIKKLYEKGEFEIHTNNYNYGINIRNRQEELTKVLHLYVERIGE